MTVVPWGQAEFDYWKLAYPEFSAVRYETAQSYFVRACLILDNTDRSPVPADALTFQPRLTLLQLLVAHIAKLAAISAAGNNVVGRISGATQGSVSVTVELEGNLPTRAWFSQTGYGLEYWQATAQWRMFRYAAPCGLANQGVGRAAF